MDSHKRQLLLGAGSLGFAAMSTALSACGDSEAATDSAAASPSRKETIVLVHGSFHGGWCWRKLSPLLRQAGYLVLAPSLTGLADRARYGSTSIGLSGHIEEIAQLLAFEDLSDVVLVGHSYAGMVLSGVAETQSARIRRLVYLDAFVPADGNKAFDFLPPNFASDWLAAAQAGSGWGVPPLPPAVFGVTNPDDASWLQAHMTPMPYLTHNEPVRLPANRAASLKRSYLWCQQSGLLDATAARVRQDAGWDFQTLDSGHDVMVTAPALLAGALFDAIARG